MGASSEAKATAHWWTTGSSSTGPCTRSQVRATPGPGRAAKRRSSRGVKDSSVAVVVGELDVGEAAGLDVGLVLVDLERGRQVEDGAAGLAGHDLARGEAAAVAEAVHLEADGLVGVAPADEVGVQGVGAERPRPR